ncbi:alpha-glucosidase [Lentzea tibetensis]|uniref:Alpha-glucosidase n=1 Tax=Lentzea tibetensis TaxID=2591470 RepID=A0A563EXY9_9PSEU|nr:glycoside hydrolase family 97 catalytic domain-containing protein [Lentzea tibetensis]TWP52597.1 alpha-glucosidase [Lentzea tibetensis]
MLSSAARRCAVGLLALTLSAAVAPQAVADRSGAAWPKAEVRVDNGVVTLGVSREGRTVLEPGPLGVVTERADLSKDLKLVRRTSRQVFEQYTATTGKERRRTVQHREDRYVLQGAARLDVVVRTSADGVAYRYELPQNTGAVLSETSAFVFHTAATAWLAKYRRDYENPFVQTTAGATETAEYLHPALFEVAGSYALLTESDVDGRHSGARLVHTAGSGAFQVKYWDEKVLVDGPWTSQWRTAIIGDLATVSASTLVDDLAAPSRVRDTSWIKPGKVFWSWLAGGREAGQSLALQKEYVDYAAAHGWPYALVDAGWYFDPNWDYDPAWEKTSWIPDLVAYAKARGVKIHLWVHYDELDTAAERATRLALFESWGISGLKIDFMDSDGQDRYRWYDQILPETAQHHLMVNFHGSTIPHGLQRTWPHVMTMEAVHGGEKSSGLTGQHLTALPFTRNVVGSMDYTPMAWHRPSRTSSDAHELGLAVVYESALANFAGKPADYAARPLAERFLDQVPTTWDETRLLSGRPADHAVFARRSGDRWFLGGGYAGAARTVQVPLSLPSGRWLVEIVRDGPAGLVREQRTVRSGDALTLDVKDNGGFAAIACRAGARTCDEPVRRVPATTVTASARGFEVTGTFKADEAVSRVSFAPRVPAGWSLSGAPVTAPRLVAGASISGKWTVTPPASPSSFGYFDVPVVASFNGGVEDEKTARVHLVKPLEAGWSYVSDKPFLTAVGGDGPVERDLSNGGAAAGDGRGIAVRRATFGKGIGTHASSEVTVALDARCTSFAASVGVDDEAGLDVARQRVGGTVSFQVLGDGVVLADTGVLGVRTPVRDLAVDVSGVKVLTLRVGDGGDGTQNDHASWGDVRVRCSPSGATAASS